MRKLFLMAAFIATLASAAQPPAVLVGGWESSGSDKALPGYMELKADGRFSLQPLGFSAVEGSYAADELEIELKLDSSPELPVTGVYFLKESGRVLDIQFSNGSTQVFHRREAADVQEVTNDQ